MSRATKFDVVRYRKLLECGVRAGDPLATYALATSLVRGDDELGVAFDLRRGIRLLKRAAGTVNRAMYELGCAYEYGFGVRRDLCRARDLYARAAAHGSLAGMDAYARVLESGIGGPVRHAQARRLRRRLAVHLGEIAPEDKVEDKVARTRS
jgi:TPR repeat protein